MRFAYSPESATVRPHRRRGEHLITAQTLALLLGPEERLAVRGLECVAILRRSGLHSVEPQKELCTPIACSGGPRFARLIL